MYSCPGLPFMPLVFAFTVNCAPLMPNSKIYGCPHGSRSLERSNPMADRASFNEGKSRTKLPVREWSRLPPPPSWIDHLAVSGLLLLIVGFSGFVFTLLLHATGITYGTPSTARTVSEPVPDEV